MLNRKATKFSVPGVLAASAWLTLAPPLHAQELDAARAVKVKAAYLYNFAKFIDWPVDVFEDEAAPFVIGVLGDDPFGEILDDTVRGKTISGRAVEIQRLRWRAKDDPAELERCQILYISRSERDRLPDISAALKGKPILLVSDIVGFASDVGMIGFVLDRQRIVFEICRETIEQAKLRASPKLLSLARVVKPGNQRLPRTGSDTGKG